MTRDEILNMPAGAQMNALITTRIFNVDGFWHGIKAYSTDISAAWEVVEKLGDKFNLIERAPSGTFWRCVIFPDGFIPLAIHSETAPLAICRAALLAVMEV